MKLDLRTAKDCDGGSRLNSCNGRHGHGVNDSRPKDVEKWGVVVQMQLENEADLEEEAIQRKAADQ
jgi:hypothetical protein